VKRATAVLAGVAALALSWPWLRAGVAWPKVVVTQLDHCPQLACDFALYYMPQIRLLHESPGEIVYGWVYPPLLAVLLQGLKLFSDAAAAQIWTALNLGLTAGLTWMCYRRLPRGLAGALGAVALVSLSLPVLHALKWGQVSLLVVTLALAGLLRGGRVGGALVGLAAAIKIYPAIFLALPLARRRLGEVGAGVASGLLLGVAAPVMALGWSAAAPFYQRVLALQDVSVAGLGGQAVSASMFRWFVDGRHIERVQRPLTDDSPLLLALPGEPAFAVILVFTVAGLAAWRLLDRRTSRATGAALTLTAAGLALPPGWHHYFVFLPFAQACVIGRGRLATGLGLASAAVAAAPILALTERPEAYFEYSQAGGTTLAALLVFVALVCVSPEGSDQQGGPLERSPDGQTPADSRDPQDRAAGTA